MTISEMRQEMGRGLRLIKRVYLLDKSALCQTGRAFDAVQYDAKKHTQGKKKKRKRNAQFKKKDAWRGNMAEQRERAAAERDEIKQVI